jgi:YVTN family beta-propeller protein
MSNYSLRTRLGRKLDQVAARDIPDNLDLWPRIAARRAGTWPTAEARNWAGPALDTRRRPSSSSPASQATEESLLLNIAAEPEPVPVTQRRWAREAFKLVAAAIVFGLVGALLALALRDEGNDGNVAAPVPTPAPIFTPSVASTPVAVQPSATTTGSEPTATLPTRPTSSLPMIEPVLTTIPVGRNPRDLAVGAGSVWVTNASDGTVSRIDPATNTVSATIAVSSAGSQTANEMAANDTAVWVMAGTTQLVRIDPATNMVVATIPVDPPIDTPVIANGALWTQSDDSHLLRRYDLATNTFTASVQIVLPQETVFTQGAVWVLHDVGRGTDSEILKLDPATGDVLATVSLDGYYSLSMLVAGDSIWVPTTDGALLQVDTGASQVVAVYPYPEDVGRVPLATSGDGRVWVCNCTNEPDDVIWQFDISARQWSARIPVGDVFWEGSLVFLDDALWSNSQEDAIIRIQLPD